MKPILDLLGRVDRQVNDESIETAALRLALVTEIRSLRDHSVKWTLISAALFEAINGARSKPIHQAFEAVAGPERHWEVCFRLIADGYAQERQREKEAKAATKSVERS